MYLCKSDFVRTLFLSQSAINIKGSRREMVRVYFMIFERLFLSNVHKIIKTYDVDAH